MKKSVPLFIVVAFAVAGISFVVHRHSTHAASDATASVEALAEHPDRFAGPIRVTGIVHRVSADRQMFSLVDVSDQEELINTGGTRCITLPVKWNGAMPSAQQVITVDGDIQQSEGKLIFVATAMQYISERLK